MLDHICVRVTSALIRRRWHAFCFLQSGQVFDAAELEHEPMKTLARQYHEKHGQNANEHYYRAPQLAGRVCRRTVRADG